MAQILIVDDEARMRETLAIILDGQGYEVEQADDGHIALEALERDIFDLLITDCQMPEMDGYEATRRIRAQARYARLPIIALTAKAMKGDREKCLAAGASDYITKPIDPDQLVSLLRVWLYDAVPMTHAG